MSDYRTDGAMDALIQAASEKDSARRQEWQRVAQIHALLSLRDAVQEATSTLKEVANRQISATQHLDATIQKATNTTITELRRATVRKVA